MSNDKNKIMKFSFVWKMFNFPSYIFHSLTPRSLSGSTVITLSQEKIDVVETFSSWQLFVIKSINFSLYSQKLLIKASFSQLMSTTFQKLFVGQIRKKCWHEKVKSFMLLRRLGFFLEKLDTLT